MVMKDEDAITVDATNMDVTTDTDTDTNVNEILAARLEASECSDAQCTVLADDAAADDTAVDEYLRFECSATTSTNITGRKYAISTKEESTSEFGSTEADANVSEDGDTIYLDDSNTEDEVSMKVREARDRQVNEDKDQTTTHTEDWNTESKILIKEMNSGSNTKVPWALKMQELCSGLESA
uniref:Uncharacterized protein n=1 Tax=Lygus hesperus TaxID=30085 RepID=A0A146KKL8_LYGHE